MRFHTHEFGGKWTVVIFSNLNTENQDTAFPHFGEPPLPSFIEDFRRICLTWSHVYDSNLPMKKEPVDIKGIRLKLGFTQEDFARKLGLTLSTVSKWEQGLFSPSRLAREKLEKLVRRERRKKSEWAFTPKAMSSRLTAGRMGWRPLKSKFTI